MRPTSADFQSWFLHWFLFHILSPPFNVFLHLCCQSLAHIVYNLDFHNKNADDKTPAFLCLDCHRQKIKFLCCGYIHLTRMLHISSHHTPIPSIPCGIPAIPCGIVVCCAVCAVICCCMLCIMFCCISSICALISSAIG